MVARSYERLHLMNLPAEIRDRIFTYAVTGQDFLPAYIETRTRSRSIAQPAMRSRMFREYKVYPELPTLAGVNRQINRDALTLFFQENVLVFNFNYNQDRPGGNVTNWIHKLGWIIDDVMKGRRIILEFDVAVLGSFVDVPRHAEIEANLSPNKTAINLRFGGILVEECTCWISGLAQSCCDNQDGDMETWTHLFDFAIEMEGLYLEQLSKASYKRSRMNSDCGKCKRPVHHSIVRWSGQSLTAPASENSN